jgi:hypothetical protein
VDVERHLHVGEILLEPLDALEELGAALDAVARAGPPKTNPLYGFLLSYTVNSYAGEPGV